MPPHDHQRGSEISDRRVPGLRDAHTRVVQLTFSVLPFSPFPLNRSPSWSPSGRSRERASSGPRVGCSARDQRMQQKHNSTRERASTSRATSQEAGEKMGSHWAFPPADDAIQKPNYLVPGVHDHELP